MQNWHLDMPRTPMTSSASWSNQQAIRLPNISPEQPQLFVLSSALVSTFPILARPLIALPSCHGPAAGSAACCTCCGNCGKPSHSQATSVNCHLQSCRCWAGVQHMGMLLSEHLLSHSSVPPGLYIHPPGNHNLQQIFSCEYIAVTAHFSFLWRERMATNISEEETGF